MPTILIVDDDLKLLSSLSAELEAADYTVLRASQLEQAGRIVATQQLDLIVLGVDSDHGHGWDLLREIVELGRAPVIVICDMGLEEDIVAALDLGAVDVLAKPFRINELKARIRRRLRSRESSADASRFEPITRADPFPSSLPSYRVRTTADEDAAPVFMDAVSERSLLQERQDVEIYAGDLEALPLGARLRVARQRRQLSLVQVELDTKLRIWYVQAMEEGRFGLLPRNGSAEDMLRNYAGYLDLDVDHAVTDFREAYADVPQQPLAYLGGKPQPREIPQWIVVGVAALLALALGIGGFWLLASDQVLAVGNNVRALIAPPTATTTPTITPFPTLTPTRTPAPTATSTSIPTNTPVPTATPQPSPTPDPAATGTITP